jgi:predicted dehydrogenase
MRPSKKPGLPGSDSSRRRFIRQLGTASLLLSTGNLSSPSSTAHQTLRPAPRRYSANDKINIACVGTGIMGFNDVHTAVQVPGVTLVAACDLYSGRLQHAKELYGKDLFTTADYREILDRTDIDAVIIATSDHWHARIATEALAKGKAVYGEKPIVHLVEEGLPLIEAQKRSGKPMQIGSQRVSSIAFAKARELYRAGSIGQLNCIDASWDRQDALGAWEYTQPADASTTTVSWDRYIAGLPAQPYDPKKFFWWRNYRAFGTGMAGDLFVHLLSGIHFITDSKGPEKIVASGMTAYWKDGRDVPDVMTAMLSYPESAEHPAIHHHKMSEAPGIGGWDALTTYPQAMQDELVRQYNARYTTAQRQATTQPPTIYKLPNDYNEDLEHHLHFYDAIRNGTPVVEDPTFGFRAAAPCLLANESYFSNKIIHWDPVAMRVIT